MDNNPLIADYYPMIPKEEIRRKSNYKFSFNDFAGVGSSFAVAAAEFAKAAVGIAEQGTAGGEGLYRCVFPKGVTGHLAKFNDGSGYLGAIWGNGLEAQARWIPVDSAAASLAIDPVTIAIAVAMMSINKKLDSIKKTQDEILHFLEQDKESELKGAINSLAEILSQFKYNSENNNWITSHLGTVSLIKVNAEKHIDFYREDVRAKIDDFKRVHIGAQDAKVFDKLQHSFKYYQLCVYLYAYASFSEVLLGKNYKKDYLEYMAKKIQDNAFDYQLDYSNCYGILDDYMKKSLDAKVLKGVGAVSKSLGSAVSKIPVIEKGPVDEALIKAGKALNRKGNKQAEDVMDSFRTYRDAGTRLFVENIETINRLCNKPVEMMFDDNMIYLCA